MDTRCRGSEGSESCIKPTLKRRKERKVPEVKTSLSDLWP